MPHKPPKRLCPECNIRYVKYQAGFYSYTCLECVSIRQKRIAKEKHQEKNILKEKQCCKCSKSYLPTHHTQKYCYNPCTYGKSTSELNKEWLEKKVDLEPKPLKGNSDAVAYDFFRKKYIVKSKFRACRG